MIFSDFGSKICSGEYPSVLGLFDFATAPQLLFYAYVPIAIVSALIGIYIYAQDRKSLRNRFLLYFLLCFIFYIVNELIQWLASYHGVLMFAWQLTSIFEISLYLSSAYFAYVFVSGKDLPFPGKLALSTIAFVVIALIPTRLNIVSYDVTECEGINGPLWMFIQIIEPIIILSITVICLRSTWREPDKKRRSENLTFTFGFVFFLLTFYASVLYGNLIREYIYNLWGAIGLSVFFLFLGYIMVKFKTFNTKVVATEALVWGLVTLIGSQFFFIKMPINFILNGVTFIAAIIFGYFLIQSVKHEIKAKEDLKITNERLEDTTSLITHQIRGVFTRTKAGLSTIVDGVFGPVSTQQQNIMNQMLQSQENGLTEVETFLQAQKVESGSIQYDRKPFDVKIVVEEISAQEKPRAEAKGLQFEVTIDAGEYLISGDAVYLTQVIANLIDNAIRYTGQGSIKVHLSRNDDKILYSVKDTGAGIKDEDKAKMFTKYGHGANSRSINPSSSGLGLYIVKGIVDGHGGKIWYESEVNKGTTFFVELPVK
jgi:signal transduction histidine kinase